MAVDDGGRWNIVDKTFHGDIWSRFSNKTLKVSMYIDSLRVLLVKRDQTFPLLVFSNNISCAYKGQGFGMSLNCNYNNKLIRIFFADVEEVYLD